MMRNALVRLGLIGFVLFGAACAKKPAGSLPTTHKENRVSQAPAGTVTVTLNRSQFDIDTDFLLTVSNSTQKNIVLPTPAQEHCYADTFWFYAKTGMGWQPRQPVSSFFCGSPRNTGDLIPGGLEKEFNLGSIIGSRYIDFTEPMSYQLRVRYLDPVGQELYLFTDEFRIGPAVSIGEFHVTVENAELNALSFYITNHSDQSIWLTPLCSSAQLASGWMDEESSALQRLTDEEAWSYVRAARDHCVQTVEPIEIVAGEAKLMDGMEWLQNAGISLQSGIYRWDLVFYLNQRTLGVENGRHVFGDIIRFKDH
jgi:hypothetical protein